MLSFGSVVRTLGASALALGFALAIGSGASARDIGILTIHKAECPTGAGAAIFDKCHGNGLEGVEFTVTFDGGEETFTTDEHGSIGPITFPEGDFTISEDPDALEDYLGAYVYCRDLLTDDVIFDSDLDGGNSVSGHFDPGSEIVCDWYDITPAKTGGVTTLPNTGSGSTGTSAVLLVLLGLLATVFLSAFAVRTRVAPIRARSRL